MFASVTFESARISEPTELAHPILVKIEWMPILSELMVFCASVHLSSYRSAIDSVDWSLQ